MAHLEWQHDSRGIWYVNEVRMRYAVMVNKDGDFVIEDDKGVPFMCFPTLKEANAWVAQQFARKDSK